MTTSNEVQGVFQRVSELLDSREEQYGNSWKEHGLKTCVQEVFRKAKYVEVQWDRGRAKTDKFDEDLLDLIGWAAFSVVLLQEELRGKDEASS